VKISDDDLTKLSPREIGRRIGFVPQEESWRFDFSVEDVVAMGRLPVSNGLFDTKEDHAEAQAAMERAGCIDLRSRPITELSGGEKQRVLIARALAQHTQIIFLDEPTAHLDPQYQIGTAELVRSLVAEGKSLILAIHDLPMAGLMADRGVLISGGKATPPRKTSELLESEELDRAYAIRFQRIETPDGLVVIPATGKA
jgi:iron complex transport system ATP-binding protein